MRPLRTARPAVLARTLVMIVGLVAAVAIGAPGASAGASTAHATGRHRRGVVHRTRNKAPTTGRPGPPTATVSLGKPRLPASGGAVTVRLHVTGATRCRLEAAPAVRLVERWTSCAGGQLARVARLSPNLAGHPRRYRITGVAEGPGGTSRAVAVLVEAARTGQGAALGVVPGDLPGKGGSFTLSYDVPGATKCDLVATPAPWHGPNPLSVACDGTYQGEVTPGTVGGRSWKLTLVASTASGTEQVTRILRQRSPSFAVVTSSLPAGVASTPYSASLSAIGGTAPYRWKVASGNLPPGTSLSPSGHVSGTPTEAGRFSFTVEATDASKPARHVTGTVTVTMLADAPGGQISANWAGEIVPSSSKHLTETSGSWTVPHLDCAATPNAGVSQWVGIGGVSWPGGGSSGALLQTGVRTRCVGGAEQASAWWEQVPSKPDLEHDFTGLTVSPGDTIVATVSKTGPSTWLTQVDDRTTKRSGVMVTGGTWGVLSDRANGRYRREGSAVGVSYSGGYSAEWIVEDYANAADGSAVPLARFATIDFSSLTTSLSTWSLATAGQIQLVRGGDSLAVPSPNPGGGFAVTDTA